MPGVQGRLSAGVVRRAMGGGEEEGGRGGGPAAGSGKGDKSGIVDMLLGKDISDQVDTETLINNVQKRVWGSLKRGYQYTGPFDESDAFLRANVLSKIEMGVMYVDLVGSTTMALELPEEKVATIISSFAQEMAYVVRQYGGYVLKFVGDAVIAYFVSGNNSLLVADRIVDCSKSMISVIDRGINPVLNQYDYPDLAAKIGADYGRVLIVQYGRDARLSPVDLMGPVMNIAAKIQSHASPNQVMVGDDVYTRLHPATQLSFRKAVWKDGGWKYRSRVTGRIYDVYEYVS